VVTLKSVLVVEGKKDAHTGIPGPYFIFKLQNRSRLSQLNGPIVFFLETGRRLKPESKSRRLIE
jgi:hypothetical protein